MVPPSRLLSASILNLPIGAERPLPAAHSDSQAARSAGSLREGGPPKADGCTGTAARLRGATTSSLAGEALKEAAL